MAKTTIVIDPEFRALIPTISDEERSQLEANLTRDGCRDPLVVWQGVLLDGHNRWDICTAHDLPYQVVEQACADRDAAKVWIITNQLGRRNLQPYQRGELVLALKPLIAAKAKAQQGMRTDISQVSVKSVDTQKELAKAAGFSHDTMAKFEVIAKEAPEEVKQQLRQGKTTINRVYKNLGRKPKTKKSRAKSKTTSATPTRAAARPVTTESPQAYAESVRAEVRDRIASVQDETLTLDQLAKRWKVHTDIARRYVREAALYGNVIKQGDQITITLTPELEALKKQYREFRAELTARRKANHDARELRRWNPMASDQHEFRRQLNWIEENLDRMGG